MEELSKRLGATLWRSDAGGLETASSPRRSVTVDPPAAAAPVAAPVAQTPLEGYDWRRQHRKLAAQARSLAREQARLARQIAALASSKPRPMLTARQQGLVGKVAALAVDVALLGEHARDLGVDEETAKVAQEAARLASTGRVRAAAAIDKLSGRYKPKPKPAKAAKAAPKPKAKPAPKAKPPAKPPPKAKPTKPPAKPAPKAKPAQKAVAKVKSAPVKLGPAGMLLAATKDQAAASAALTKTAETLIALAEKLKKDAVPPEGEPEGTDLLDPDDLADAYDAAALAAQRMELSEAERAAALLAALSVEANERAESLGANMEMTATGIFGMPSEDSQTTDYGGYWLVGGLETIRGLGLSDDDWARLPGELRDEILQAAEAEGPEDYRQYIKMYFREVARRATAVKLTEEKR